MKKTIIITILFSLLLTSCNDNEKKEPAVFVNNTKNSTPVNEEISTETVLNTALPLKDLLMLTT